MISEVDILLRLGLAALFGSFIGLERERQFWAAGLRTHMMVSVGACLFMIVSNYAAFEALNSSTDPRMRFDPTRIAAQVVTGIGFIGAGTILFVRKGVVRGLTTAAGLWTVSAIGLATGGGMFVAAGATTAIALTILWLFKQFGFIKSNAKVNRAFKLKHAPRYEYKKPLFGRAALYQKPSGYSEFEEDQVRTVPQILKRGEWIKMTEEYEGLEIKAENE